MSVARPRGAAARAPEWVAATRIVCRRVVVTIVLFKDGEVGFTVA